MNPLLSLKKQRTNEFEIVSVATGEKTIGCV
jgi:hypothetical protein